jgi:hypothetical protein
MHPACACALGVPSLIEEIATLIPTLHPRDDIAVLAFGVVNELRDINSGF